MRLGHAPYAILAILALLSVAPSCTKGDDTDSGGGTGTTSVASTSSTSSTSSTAGSSSSSSASTSTTTAATSSTSTLSTSGTSDVTTGVDVGAFERFRMNSAAGPCPPDLDCDGFVELVAPGTLRVERFGEVGDPVTEVPISADDYAAAVLVFGAADLIAVLDGPDPLCNPPTDIYESMEVVVDGVLHDATTTACDQAPLVAARGEAKALAAKYAP